MNRYNNNYRKTKIHTPASLSEIHINDDSILIIDSSLLSFKFVKSFIKKFAAVYKVDAGESLKDFSKLHTHLSQILKLTKKVAKKNLALYSLGGGSTSDFTGFVSSIIHRGISVTHIPSTWISSLDSAHGGKTGMNLSGYKNQIGTFWYASDVILCRELLETQSESLFKESFGEILKIAFIDSEKLFKQISAVSSSAELFPFTKKLVSSKYKVLKQDPFEKRGYRKILNLGHTVGHAYEAKFLISHGKAVLFGMHFSIWLSFHLKFMPENCYLKTMKVLAKHVSVKELIVLVNGIKNQLITLISYDKKMNSKNTVSFVFAKKAGSIFYQDIDLNTLNRYFKQYHQQLKSNELFF